MFFVFLFLFFLSFFLSFFPSLFLAFFQFQPLASITVLKPGLDHFNSMKWIIRKAEYDPTTGWQNYYHNFPGSMGSAGPMTWYLLSRPSTEIDHCVYTFENVNPYFTDVATGAETCRVPDEKLPNNECFDCRGVPAEEVSIAFLRECGAPWACTKSIDQRCNDIFREWFSMRTEFEDNVSPYPLSSRTGVYEPEIFLGFRKKDRRVTPQ